MRKFLEKRVLPSLMILILCLLTALHAVPAQDLPKDTAQYPIYKIELPELTAWAVVDSPLLVPAAIMSIEFDPVKKAEGKFIDNVFTTCTNGHVIKMKDRLILADCGWGREQATDIYNTGYLYERLVEAGVNPADITDIIISHMDVDHFPGASNQGARLYPNAKVHVARDEYFPFIEEGILRGPHPIKMARGTFEAYKDQTTLFEYNHEILPNIKSVATKGHTAGHTCFIIKGGEGWQLAVTGDLVHAYPLQFYYPENADLWDIDTVAMAHSRISFLESLCDTNTIYTGCHVSEIGLVRRRSVGGYELIPVPERVSVVSTIDYK